MIGSCNTVPVKYSLGARRVGPRTGEMNIHGVSSLFSDFVSVDYFLVAA